MGVMKSLNFKFDQNIDSAHIITIKGNKTSESYAQRCMESCEKHDMISYFHEAFYVKNNQVVAPKSLKNQGWVKWIKCMNEWLTLSEVACFLSHVSTWAKCIELDKPIVIFEHDAILIKPYTYHVALNSIGYLGCKYQIQKQDARMIYGQLNSNYRFMYCAHAYSIDPYMAKNLLSQVIKYGITTSLDAFIRGDIFNIIQNDIYAYDDGPISTITHPSFNNHEESQRKYLNAFKT